MYFLLQIQLEDMFYGYRIFESEEHGADMARALGRAIKEFLEVPVRVLCGESENGKHYYTIIWGSEYPPEDFNSEGFLIDDTVFTSSHWM